MKERNKKEMGIVMYVAACDNCTFIETHGAYVTNKEQMDHSLKWVEMMKNAHLQWYPQHKVRITAQKI